MNRHKIIARFGLMHMIATNVCEWLYVLVEETKHEIIHLGGKFYEKVNVIFKQLIVFRTKSQFNKFGYPCKILPGRSSDGLASD